MIIALPEKVYILRNRKDQDILYDIEEYNIYFKNIILPYREEYDVKVECQYGKNYGEFWRITEFPYECDSFPLTIRVYDDMGEKLGEKACTVYMNNKKKTNEYCVLPLGDSMTHETTWLNHLIHKINNVKTCGLRSFDNHIHTEGRGGWSYKSYNENGNSPFLFPKGINAKDYFGDIDFENLKKDEETHKYSCDGLPLYDISEGMYYRKDGKLLKKGKDEDVLISENPEWELSFTKYMERYQMGHIDAVSMLMGGNDLQNISYEDCDETVRTYVQNTEKMIASIWEYDPEIKIILNLPIIGAEQYSWGKQRKCAAGAKTYRFGVIKAAQALIDKFDKKDGIFIAGTLLNIDPVFGFDLEPYRGNKYVDHYVMKHENWVHPNPNGYKQIGDAVAAVIEAIR